jgi:hypothetical protein
MPVSPHSRSPDKQVVGYPGPHAETNPDAVARLRDFVRRNLT